MDEEIEKIATAVVNAGYRIHARLGPGLLETVYEVVLANALRGEGFTVERQRIVPIEFDGLRFDEGFRADLIVDGKVLVELKSVAALAPVHSKQVLTYLRLLDFRLGLLINFHTSLYKEGIRRIAN